MEDEKDVISLFNEWVLHFALYTIGITLVFSGLTLLFRG